MLVERLAHPTQAASSPTAALRQAFACWWWLVRLYMADLHGLPRKQALEPPPARWLDAWRSRLD